ncbi:MAG TPA: hypothetical protein VN946_20765, partial [Terriglobales bacterium]|nr:hypothetical protein [Terriglobales bacterium]
MINPHCIHRRVKERYRLVLGLLLFVSLLTLGCGGNKSSTSNSQSTPASQVTVMVTGTSGSLSHS